MVGFAFVAGTGSAQTYTVNGVTQPSPLIESATLSAVSVDPFTGNVAIRTAAPAGTPVVSISAAPASVSVNGTTTVSWSTSGFTGALNCTRTSSPALSGWTGTSTLASGSVAVTMPSAAQTVTLTLSCTGGNGTASNSTNVAVTQPGGVDCSTRPPGYNSNGTIAGTSPRSLVVRPFLQLFNEAFPGTSGSRWQGDPNGVADGAVLAFEFVAANTLRPNGRFEAVDNPDRGGFGQVTTAISECPGHIAQRSQSAPAELSACWGGFLKTSAYWSFIPGNNDCLLIPGKTYYYNITMSERCLNANNQPSNCGLRVYTR